MQIRKSGTSRSLALSPPAPLSCISPGARIALASPTERHPQKDAAAAALPSLPRGPGTRPGAGCPSPPPPQPTGDAGADAQGEGGMRAGGGQFQHTAWLWEVRVGQCPGEPQHSQAMDNHAFTRRCVVPVPRRRQPLFPLAAPAALLSTPGAGMRGWERGRMRGAAGRPEGAAPPSLSRVLKAARPGPPRPARPVPGPSTWHGPARHGPARQGRPLRAWGRWGGRAAAPGPTAGCVAGRLPGGQDAQEPVPSLPAEEVLGGQHEQRRYLLPLPRGWGGGAAGESCSEPVSPWPGH